VVSDISKECSAFIFNGQGIQLLTLSSSSSHGSFGKFEVLTAAFKPLGCYTVLLGKWFLMVPIIIVPSSSDFLSLHSQETAAIPLPSAHTTGQ
jgi:hypothetical protein